MNFSSLVQRFKTNKRAISADYATCRGEQLAEPIYWEGRQWAVTEAGIECRDGTYFIDKKRLWEEEGKWGWVNQLSEKEWVDIEDFVIALTLAREKFKDHFPS